MKKIGYLLLAVVIIIFTVIPQNASAEMIKSNESYEELYRDLNIDQETIDLFNELDQYLIEFEDGSIKLDLQSASLDDVQPELLNIINIVNDIEVQDGKISTADFAFPIGNYGRYCGKGNKGGKPIDDLDAACQKHDRCFKGFNSKSKKCNQEFVRRLLPIVQATYPVSKKGAYARAAVYLFSKYM